MNDLLIEIGCEDLPARFVKPLADTLHQSVLQSLKDSGFVDDARGDAFATPRRIAVRFNAIADRAKDRSIERKGPKLAAAIKDGQPTQAGPRLRQNLRRSSFQQLAQEDGQLVFRMQQAGRPVLELVPEIVDARVQADGRRGAEAHALGQRYRHFRAPGAMADRAAGQRGRAFAALRPERRPTHLWPPLPCAGGDQSGLAS